MKRPLIVSYSYSGHTHRIAQVLHALTGGDWCEIYPWQPYPMAFPELLEQVQKEIQTGCHPCLLPGAANAGEYEVIFVGSPNWCGHIAPPLASWLTKNDLSSKVILPFYSHCGGAVGNIGADIAALCPGAEVREALGVLHSGQPNLPQEIRRWLEAAGALQQASAALSF